MALPTDPAETFVREVDENLRRDQMRDMAKAYGKWIVAAVILFLAAIGGYLYWQSRQQAAGGAESEAMSAALDKAESGNVKAAVGRADPAQRVLKRREPGQRHAGPRGARAAPERPQDGDRLVQARWPPTRACRSPIATSPPCAAP